MDENANNQEIHDCSESQKLSSEQIEVMKKSQDVSGRVLFLNLTQQEIIQSIVENNVAFDKKTDFSKAKYLKKKASKYVFPK